MKYLNVKAVPMRTNGGSANPNQIIIYTDTCTIFQSYGTTIAVIGVDGVVLDEKYWDYSSTTGRYRNDFLVESIKETRIKIKSGEYKLKNLN